LTFFDYQPYLKASKSTLESDILPDFVSRWVDPE